MDFTLTNLHGFVSCSGRLVCRLGPVQLWRALYVHADAKVAEVGGGL